MELVLRVSFRFLIGIAAILVLVATALLLSPIQAARALPPRPALPTELASGPSGGSIELHARFPSTWPWSTTDWQDLWTIVQWQDNNGAWHSVNGWQGTFDLVKVGEGEEITGQKAWWVSTSDLGKGPFRWQVYRSQGGTLAATSEPFDLPGTNGAIVTVEVSLTP
jgi:hypothetical protein